MATTTRLLTYADLDETPDDGRRYEIIGGRLVVTASPILKHQKLSLRLTDLLYELEKAGLGEVFEAPTDVELGPNDIVVPDLVFVTAARLGILGRQKIEGAPDILIEILSPSTSGRDEGEKRDLYARSGVREYWLVDPEQNTVRALTLVDGAYEPIPPSGNIVRSIAVPEFRVDVDALFAGLR
jgi:Uma2 family endonuclease